MNEPFADQPRPDGDLRVAQDSLDALLSGACDEDTFLRTVRGLTLSSPKRARSGNLHGDASFSWWTESGTAKPGQDFEPIAAHEEHIGEGKSAVSLLIPVVADPTRQQPKSFYVVISDPSEVASLGHRKVTMVTISPAE